MPTSGRGRRMDGTLLNGENTTGMQGQQPATAWAAPTAPPSEPYQADPLATAQAVEVPTAQAVWAESNRPNVLPAKTPTCSFFIFFAGMLQVLLFGCVGALVSSLAGLVRLAPDAEDEQSLLQGLMGACGVILLIMLIECTCCSPSKKFLANFQSDEGAYAHVERVRKAGPNITWHVQCYHYRTEHYTETSTDSDGNTHTHHRTRQVRVNTWAATMQYIPWAWEDITSEFPHLGEAPLTRCTFTKMYAFADSASAQHFNNAKSEFKWRNRRDQYMDFHESFSISGYESHMLAATRPELAPKWLNLSNYYIFTALCCTVPFRIKFAQVSWELPKFTYIKRIYAPGSVRVVAPVPIIAPAWPVGNDIPTAMAVATAVPAAQYGVAQVVAVSQPVGAKSMMSDV